ncbi:hypothetical protein M426DRAFT_7617 [Hypoxylon sp. CI-4A]|nr:hypothetical protein M426DRAFT_7617 [Hypoxylon sp. CI-4A]
MSYYGYSSGDSQEWESWEDRRRRELRERHEHRERQERQERHERQDRQARREEQDRQERREREERDRGRSQVPQRSQVVIRQERSPQRQGYQSRYRRDEPRTAPTNWGDVDGEFHWERQDAEAPGNPDRRRRGSLNQRVDQWMGRMNNHDRPGRSAQPGYSPPQPYYPQRPPGRAANPNSIPPSYAGTRYGGSSYPSYTSAPGIPNVRRVGPPGTQQPGPIPIPVPDNFIIRPLGYIPQERRREEVVIETADTRRGRRRREERDSARDRAQSRRR